MTTVSWLYLLLMVAIPTASTDEAEGWIPIGKKDVSITYDLEQNPLEIKTENKPDTTTSMYVKFYTSSDAEIGAIMITMKKNENTQYIPHCSPEVIMTETLPAATEKIWRITLTRNSGVRLQVHCNGVVVLDKKISGSTCDSNNYENTWDGNLAHKIEFGTSDSASKFYRPQPRCGKPKISFGKVFSEDEDKERGAVRVTCSTDKPYVMEIKCQSTGWSTGTKCPKFGKVLI